MSDLVRLTIIDRVGVPYTLDVPTDMNLNLMEVCRANGMAVEGICGGMCLCASCHVYVEEGCVPNFPSDSEEAMLDKAFHVKENSRLGCQIKITEHLKDAVFRVAPK